ncbi:hypothetical protein [Rhodanobacter lindaniclasticus]
MAVDPAFVEHAGQLFLRQAELLPRLHTLALGESRLDQFLLARLHGEVGHREGDGLVAQVAVLGDQVAGIAGERQIVDFPLRTLGELMPFAERCSK